MNYAQLMTASEDEGLARKIRVAVIVAADKIAGEPAATPNHANRVEWARATMLDPIGAAQRILWSVLAKNLAKTLAEVRALTDIDVQASVEASVDLFAG